MNPMTALFRPAQAYFEPAALDYPLGRELYARLMREGIPLRFTSSHNRVTGLPGETPREAFRAAKRTLVVGIKRDLDFEPCRPSADFSLVLATGCPAACEYCYLQTTLGRKPYVRVYVNVEEILAAAGRVIAGRRPEITVFEAASTADPLALEHLTGSLRRAVEWFGREECGRLRLVTKFAAVEPLLDADHRRHTRVRFTLNAEPVRRLFEHRTAPQPDRLAAAVRLRDAGYPIGFVLAPLMLFRGWRESYSALLDEVAAALGSPAGEDLTFELIQYRFTPASKRIIQERFPATQLDLREEGRHYKRGKYGRGKWVYAPAQAEALRGFLVEAIAGRFPAARVEYFT
ncbi:MAG: spore photoproduct lyase [Bacillota bacterium]|nr:spore photoproduct lyase [Bacillota bacterium]